MRRNMICGIYSGIFVYSREVADLVCGILSSNDNIVCKCVGGYTSVFFPICQKHDVYGLF
jgi:hypothetical protein